MVAITGTRDGSNGEYVPPGDLGTVEASGPITDPDLINLYHAELEFRKLTILPIHILSFTAQKISDEKVRIEWKLADPEDNNQLILQWSADGIHFSDISREVSSKNISYYIYDHNTPNKNSTNYYRLKIVAQNGKTQLSGIKSIRTGGPDKISLSVYPNPVADKLVAKFSSAHPINAESIRILDASGKIVNVIQDALGNNNNQLIIDVVSIPAGYYYVEIKTKEGSFKSSFIKR